LGNRCGKKEGESEEILEEKGKEIEEKGQSLKEKIMGKFSGKKEGETEEISRYRKERESEGKGGRVAKIEPPNQTAYLWLL